MSTSPSRKPTRQQRFVLDALRGMTSTMQLFARMLREAIAYGSIPSARTPAWLAEIGAAKQQFDAQLAEASPKTTEAAALIRKNPDRFQGLQFRAALAAATQAQAEMNAALAAWNKLLALWQQGKLS